MIYGEIEEYQIKNKKVFINTVIIGLIIWLYIYISNDKTYSLDLFVLGNNCSCSL